MSLFALSSTASRHLRHQLLSTSGSAPTSSLRIGSGNISAAANYRHFANGAKGESGSGLRRTQTKGRGPTAVPKSQPSSQTNTVASTEAGRAAERFKSDPHFIANEMVASGSGGGRAPGTEAVATLTKEQKISNFAMATGLFGFVSYIFYYSLASVGGAENAKALIFGGDIRQTQEGGETVNPGFEEFLKEANEGRSVEEKRIQAEDEARGEARELAELENSTAARLKAEGVEDSSANEEEEREMARVAGFVDGEAGAAGKKRPLWKRAVFFWRRE